MKEGEFNCPQCGNNGMSAYLKWQSKDEKWIFFKKGEGWEYKALIMMIINCLN